MVPTLFIICILSFFLYQFSGSDSVDSLLIVRGLRGSDEQSIDYRKEYTAVSQELGTQEALFYFSMMPHYYPDTLHRISIPSDRHLAKSLLEEYRDWHLIQSYMLQLRSFSQTVQALKLNTITDAYSRVVSKSSFISINRNVEAAITEYPKVVVAHRNLVEAQRRLYEEESFSFFYPSINFHGTHNQFHRWFVKLISFDFGQSLIDGRPITTKIWKAMSWSLCLGLIAVILSTLIAIPFGFYAAFYHQGIFDRFGFLILYMIFSIPLFWMATMFIVFFTSDDFGSWTDIFPSVGTFFTGKTQGTLGQIWYNIDKLILPIFCMVIHSLAYVGRQMRSSVLNEKNQPYYKTAVAKGISHREAMRKHVLANSLLPIFTIVISRIPSAIAGSLVIEVLFNIPGMGRLLFSSIHTDDWNTISAILILISLVTMIIYLIGDIAYRKIDPRIKYDLS